MAIFYIKMALLFGTETEKSRMLHGFQKIGGDVRFQFPETLEVELDLPLKAMHHSRLFSLDQGGNLFLVFFKQFEVSL